MALMSSQRFIKERETVVTPMTLRADERGVFRDPFYLLPDTASRWESVPSHEDVNEAFNHDTTTIGDLSRQDEDLTPMWKQPKKGSIILKTNIWIPWDESLTLMKILAPHIFLIISLLFYTALGAAVLQSLEDGPDLTKTRDHFLDIETMYDKIINKTWIMVESDSRNRPASIQEWDDLMRAELLNLSSLHVGFTFHPRMKLKSRWTFNTAVLYTLTVLTTCGYTAVEPATIGGKFFCIAFALLGIPMMFITAADIGKFLSDRVLMLWRKSSELSTYLKSKLFPAKSGQSSRKTSSSTSSRHGLPSEDQELLEMLDEEPDNSLWFPIAAYVVMVCGYCALGAWMYMSWEENWDFIYAFYFAFNLITTVGLGMVVVEHTTYLILNVIYVIIGLAVVTMCVDLASSQLKAYFTRIHYSGRAQAHFQLLSDDVRGMMQTLQALRRDKGGKLTLAEVRSLLQLPLTMRPFCPEAMYLWRYIDESHSQMSKSEQALNRVGGSSGSALLPRKLGGRPTSVIIPGHSVPGQQNQPFLGLRPESGFWANPQVLMDGGSSVGDASPGLPRRNPGRPISGQLPRLVIMNEDGTYQHAESLLGPLLGGSSTEYDGFLPAGYLNLLDTNNNNDDPDENSQHSQMQNGQILTKWQPNNRDGPNLDPQ